MHARVCESNSACVCVRAWCVSQVHIATAWLSSADYPRLLGAADIGVSLHTSSSGEL